jgi:hypothetical protein
VSEGDRPATLPRLPPELVARQKARDEAREHRVAMLAAHDRLASDLAETRDVLRRCEENVNQHAVAIIAAEADDLADRLHAACALAVRLSEELCGLGALWLPSVNGQPRPFPLSPSVVRTLRNDEIVARLRQPLFPSGAAIARWRAKLDALICDDDDPPVAA